MTTPNTEDAGPLVADALPLANVETLTKPPARRFAYVSIPEIGVRFRIRSLFQNERAEVERGCLNSRGRLNLDKMIAVSARLIVAAVVDQEGNPIYSARDIPTIMMQDSLVIGRLDDEIRKHCGISDADREELEKNYGTIPSDNLHSR